MTVDVLNREVLGLIPWVVGSWLLAAVAGLLFWFARSWGKAGRWVVRFLEGEDWLLAPAQILGAIYALGLPYTALLLGFLDARIMGLAGLSWWQTLGRGALLGGGLLLLGGIVWWAYLRAGNLPAGLLYRQRKLAAAVAGRPLLLPWAAAEEVHWAFYRALPMLLWGNEVGLWIGLLLIVAERYANPQTTARMRQPGGLEEEAWWLTKVLVMTGCFAVLGNLWACILLHALLEGVVAWLVQRKAQSVEPWPAPLARAPAAPAVLLAVSSAVFLLVLFAWGGMRPRPAPPPTTVVEVPPTVLVIPTPTSMPTSSPTPLPTPTDTPTPLPTATVTPTPQITYVVQPGDTLNAIADLFDVSVVDLMELNGITDPTKLQIGQVLIIP